MGKITSERIYAVLLGIAYGDAYGMPTEGMSWNAIHRVYPNGIQEFLPSINFAISKRHFEAGTVTDDTIHTLLLIDAIYRYKKAFSSAVYLEYLRNWYVNSSAANQVIGPSTLKAIQAVQKNEYYREARYAVTNGAMMKIAPIGLLLENKKDILDYVCRVNMPTHASNVCLTSAAAIAFLISRFTRNQGEIEDIQLLCNEMISYCEGCGFDMPSASLQYRIQLALEIAAEHLSRDDFLKKLYERIGSSIYCTETLPCVLAIVTYANGNIQECASLCASLGGDTDTIGSIACSLCGALGSIPTAEDIGILEDRNNIELEQYVKKIIFIKKELTT